MHEISDVQQMFSSVRRLKRCLEIISRAVVGVMGDT